MILERSFAVASDHVRNLMEPFARPLRLMEVNDNDTTHNSDTVHNSDTALPPHIEAYLARQRSWHRFLRGTGLDRTPK